MARLKLGQWDSAIADCAECLQRTPDSMKAHYSLSQAHLALHAYDDALRHALEAHRLCVKAGDKSLGTITTHVLKCKKERWDEMEKRRVRETGALEGEVLELLARERDAVLKEAEEEMGEAGRAEVEEEWRAKMEAVREVFERARPKAEKRRQVPDWAIDDISFCVMVDPVIVSVPSRSRIVARLRQRLIWGSADKNGQVLRARLHRRASAPPALGSAYPRAVVPVRAQAQSRPQTSLRGVSSGERLGCRLVGPLSAAWLPDGEIA